MYPVTSLTPLRPFPRSGRLRILALSLPRQRRHHQRRACCLSDIADIKPDDMEELSEVITRAEFHPTHDSQLVYSSSKGLIRESARSRARTPRVPAHGAPHHAPVSTPLTSSQ